MKNIVFSVLIIILLVILTYLFVTERLPFNTAIKTELMTPIPRAEENRIMILSPEAGDSVDLPFTIAGMVRVFEGFFQYRVSDVDGNVLFENYPTTIGDGGIGQFSSFEVDVFYDEPATKLGLFEAFEYLASDGSVINIVTVPVQFSDIETKRTDIFFGNSQIDPGITNCDITYPVVRRIAVGSNEKMDVLKSLIIGPSSSERAEGYVPSLFSWAQIKTLLVEDDIAMVDFGGESENWRVGLCSAQMIKSQIENTLLQFDDINSVVITVDGVEFEPQP